jgi:hypothetical protein
MSLSSTSVTPVADSAVAAGDSSPSPLLSLPPEIVAAIRAHLPDESAAALALTSRHFFRHLAPSCAALDKEQRLAVLAWLEKDTPDLYLCYDCEKLHTWRRGKPYREGIAPDDVCCGSLYKSRFSVPPHESYSLRFHVAQLVMNRHCYGEGHGLPLDALSHQSTRYDEGVATGIRRRQVWHARIIDDELYLETSLQLYHETGCARGLRVHVDSGVGECTRLVCWHLGLVHLMSPWDPVYPWARVAELDRPHGLPDGFLPVKGALKSCPFCFTDYRINVQQQPLGPLGGPEVDGWVVDVKRWVQLGSFRSPDDKKWNSYTRYRVRYHDITAQRRSSCEPRAVYANWRKGDVDRSENSEDSDLAIAPVEWDYFPRDVPGRRY